MEQNRKFTIRPLRSEDAESMANQLNNKKIWDNLRDGLPLIQFSDFKLHFTSHKLHAHWFTMQR